MSSSELTVRILLRTLPTQNSTDGRMAPVTTSWTWKWSLKQLYYLMNAKLLEGVKDIVRTEASKGNIRGAQAWKRVQVYDAGLTQNRRAVSFDDLAIVLPKWERKVRDLEHFPQSGVTDEVKMDLPQKIIPTSLQQFTSALISARGYNYEKLRYFVVSQVAQNRTAKSYDQGSKFDSKNLSGMIICEVSTEHREHPEPQRSVEQWRRTQFEERPEGRWSV